MKLTHNTLKDTRAGIPVNDAAVSNQANKIGADFTAGRNMLRGQQQTLTKPQRLVSNAYQYPARYATGGAATVAGGSMVNSKVRKSAIGPFNVEIRKGESYTRTKNDPEFRPSVVQRVNPRSETYVRRGTAPGRYVATAGGSIVGGAVVPVVGSPVGATVGRRHNMKKDKVRAYRRSDKKQAQKWTGVAPDMGMYYYGKDPVKKYYQYRDEIEQNPEIEKLWNPVKAVRSGRQIKEQMNLLGGYGNKTKPKFSVNMMPERESTSRNPFKGKFSFKRTKPTDNPAAPAGASGPASSSTGAGSSPGGAPGSPTAGASSTPPPNAPPPSAPPNASPPPSAPKAPSSAPPAGRTGMSTRRKVAIGAGVGGGTAVVGSGTYAYGRRKQ